MTWQQLIDLGLALYRLGRTLAEREGVSPEEFAAREAIAANKLSGNVDELIAELRLRATMNGK